VAAAMAKEAARRADGNKAAAAAAVTMTKLFEPDRRHTACPSGPPAHTARQPKLSGRDTRARTYSSGL
jgi:hypothetical protein